MAEFRLGRIKFVWKGTWAPTTAYVVDDVIINGGKSYICVINHTSSAAFATDGGANPTKWNLVADGTSWRGNWATSTYYNVGDLAKYGGIVYICKTVHTSAATTDDGLEIDQLKWDAFATSYNWTGNWTTDTKYRLNDFVKYGGVVYLCTTAHISDASSTNGLEQDIGNWTAFNEGIQYLGDWSASTVRYKLNDVVKYGADLWICVTPHTSSATFDGAKFEIFVNGLQFEDSWDNATVYQIGDVVTYGGYAYIAKTNHTNISPTDALYGDTNWDLFTTGFNYQGEWSSSTAYKLGDVIRRGGYTYIAILDGTNQAPPNLTYWEVLNTGLKTISIPQTYTAVSGTNVGAGGLSATFDVTRSGTTYTVAVPGSSTGTGYAIGNQIKILGSNLGGVTPANDLLITVESVTSGAINTVSSSGISVTWTSGNTYILGDVVMWGVSSYVCVSAHVAASGNRPDADLLATYWNLLAGGSEPAVMTTQGDMFYFSANGPARLPIGIDGQVLRVTNGFPSWDFYGLVNNVVYVAPTGTDGPAEEGWGETIDKPWQTVRHACQQVEQGYQNKQAQSLLVKNKQFLMKEVTSWIENTYTVAITAANNVNNSFVTADTATLVANMPFVFDGTVGGVTAGQTYYIKTVLSGTEFSVSETLVNGVAGAVKNLVAATANMTGTLSYNSTKCERDVGIIVDAIAFDISHGGNFKTVEAAKSYYTAGNAYITANFGQQAIQTAAAYTYLSIILGNVLANTAPTTDYQALQSVADPALQIIDTTLTAEAGVASKVGTLVNIITNGILGESITAIPAPSYPNTTISVKTGTYFEILPIVLPSYTALVGDELRSTVIQPQPAIAALATDKAKTISALERISAIIPTVISNSAVTPTTGNTVTQNTLLPAGTSGSTEAITAIVDNAELMYDIINNGISEIPAVVMTDPTGYNTSFLAGYGNGRAQLEANVTYIKAEIAAYLNTNYNAVWTALGVNGQAGCARDIGYILDAVMYDMTYGGNTQSLITGSAYYSFSNLTIGSNELEATVAAYGRLKTVVGQIVLETDVTESSGNSETQNTLGTPGSPGSSTFAQARVQDVIDWITNGTAPATITPTAIAIADANLQASYAALQAARAEIQSDTVAWVKKYFQYIDFDTTVCSRDAGLIVDALSFDALFGTNFNSIVAGRSYFRAISSVDVVMTLQKEAELGAINFIKYKAKAIAGAGASAQSINAINDIIGTIKGGATPRLVWPDYTGIDAQDAAAAKLIWNNKEFIQAETLAYITANYSSLVYDQTACSRDVGLIVDALRYDLTYGGNYASRQSGLAYLTGTSLTGIGAGEKVATLAAYANLKTIVQDIANGGLSAYTPLGTVDYVAGTAGDATSATNVGNLVDAITTTIDTGTAPSETLPSTSWVASNLTSAESALQSAKTTIQSNVIAYIDTNFPSLVYNSTTCSRDVGYIIDAIGYDFMLGSNYRSVLNGSSYYRAQAGLVIGSQKEATLAAFNYLKSQIEVTLTIYSAAKAIASKNMQTVINILDKGVGESPEVHGTVSYNNTLGTIRGAEILRANKDFLASEATAWISETFKATVTATTASTGVLTTSSAHKFVVGDPIVLTGATTFGSLTFGTIYYVASVTSTTGFTLEDVQGVAIVVTDDTGSMTATYSYDPIACQRDMSEYVSAVVEDLLKIGNYRSVRAARLYNNAVAGSKQEDMFLVANGSGLRNCTLNGLTGTLTNANSYGTKRPTAGAFVALNPGFGPNDSNVWVLTRSHYSQNVTMFGTGCTGAKIDAALHTGGNKSMVKNDFTTILSDGIGVWCTGSGSLTELVSVFNYYGYAGYLAELGGKIRATNGNSSYGTYGVIAEGVDTYEVPKYGTVNNIYNEAQVGLTVTDSTTQILRLEYSNAGSNYTNNLPTISGSGYNALAVGDEFRDRAVFETRIIDKNDGQGVGGTNYASFANAAQEGQVGQITIAATDTTLTDGYNGMRIQITAGTGVGQYANILTYLNGSKVAKVYKDSFTNLTVTGSTDSGDTLTVASTASLYANMPIYLGSAIGGLSANTLYFVKSGFTATAFQVSTTSGGTAEPVTSDTTGQLVTLYAAGWDHVVPGKATQNTLDLTSAYIIEPRISYTAPGFTAIDVISPVTGTWVSMAYGNGNFVAVSDDIETQFSTDGLAWLPAGALPSKTWTDVVYGGGTEANGIAIVGGLGGTGAVLVAELGEANTTGAALADQVARVIVVDGGQNYITPPTIVFTSGSGTGAVASCTVLNGKIQTVTISIPGSGYTSAPTVVAATDRLTSIEVAAWGRNYFSTPTVVVGYPAGLTPTAWASLTSVTVGDILVTTDGNIYEVTNGGTTASTKPVHTTGSTTNGSATLLWVAAQAKVTAVLTNTGVSGYTFTNYGAGYATTPTVSIIDQSAKFVVIANGTDDAYYQTIDNLGTSWIASTSTTGKTDLNSLAYGAGTYVAVGGTAGTASAVSSTDGLTWIDRSLAITGTADSYSSVAYGAGVFVAISTNDTVTSFSANGVSWTAGGSLPSSQAWKYITYGNGRFVAITASGTAVAYSIDKGANWLSAPAGIGQAEDWGSLSYGQGLFVATATTGSSAVATSPDGVNWTARALNTTGNWIGTFGNPNHMPMFVAASSTDVSVIRTGATALGRIRVAAGIVTETRMIEPGSGYPAGVVADTTTNTIATTDTTNLINNQPVEFTGLDAQGLLTNTTYYVIGSSIVTDTSFQVSATSGSTTPVSIAAGTGLVGLYRAGPIWTVIDPNNVRNVALRVRQGDGALGNPSFTNRGADNATATAVIQGDGYADLYQPSTFLNVANLYELPAPGANVEFASLPGVYFKLVTVTNVLGANGNYTAQFQINPGLTVLQAPAQGDVITTRLAYSQVRLTGHDFLYIGTGNQTQTNYPYVDPTTASQAAQTNSSGGGRVFFTSTDQDGNFNVGNLFGVQQATGTATLNASAFNLSGLNSLQLGAVSIGVGSAIINQFSTDPYFTANSDNIVPTQRAIKAYITAQIGGGSSSLNVNTLTSGVIYVANNTISTTSGQQINVTSKMNFTGGIDGAPVALGFFMQR